VCCPDGSNCAVQFQTVAEHGYVDGSNNRTRWEEPGSVIVYLYDLQKELSVGSDGSCLEFCPLYGDVLDASFVDSTAKLVGTELIDGVFYNKWQWKDTIFGIIVMDTITVWVDESQTPPVPFKAYTDLTPFGQELGYFQTQYSQLKFGQQDPALFNITGVDSCPESPNCDSDSTQATRLRAGVYRTWAHHHQMKKPKTSKKM